MATKLIIADFVDIRQKTITDQTANGNYIVFRPYPGLPLVYFTPYPNLTSFILQNRNAVAIEISTVDGPAGTRGFHLEPNESYTFDAMGLLGDNPMAEEQYPQWNLYVLNYPPGGCTLGMGRLLTRV